MKMGLDRSNIPTSDHELLKRQGPCFIIYLSMSCARYFKPRWTDGWLDGWRMYEWIDEGREGGREGWRDGGGMEGWMAGWMEDVRMDR